MIITVEWVSIIDRLPPHGEKVLLCTHGGVIAGELLSTDKNGHHWDLYVNNKHYNGYRTITHFMPYPIPCKAEKAASVK